MPETAGHISELKQMHEVAEVKLGDFFQPKDIFTYPNEVETEDLANDETPLA